MPNATQRHSRSRWSTSLGIAIASALAVGVILLAFLWPTITAKAQNLPVAVTGPTAQVQALTKALNAQSGNPFALTHVASRTAAVNGIKARSYDGAIVLGSKPEVLTASAAETTITPMMVQVQQQLQALVPAVTVALTDVVPLASTDAHGVGMMAASFPLVIGGTLGGVLLSLLISGVWRRLASAAVYAIAGGFVIVSIMQGWFRVLQGDYLVNVTAVTLSLFATAAFITGMAALIGRPGIAVGAVFTMLIGNPLSAATAPQQFIPQPWGDVGQWLVPGAATSLLRELSYFPDAATVFPWMVLAGWAVLGVLLMTFGHFRSRQIVHVGGRDERHAHVPEATMRVPVAG